MIRLSVSVVTYFPDFELFDRFCHSLKVGLRDTERDSGLQSGHILLVDNSGDASVFRYVRDMMVCTIGDQSNQLVVKESTGNIGYGRAHNLAVSEIGSDYHAILNPDVELDEQALVNACHYMEENPEVAMITPHVVDGHGNRVSTAKRYPSVLDLGLRGFGGEWLKRLFSKRLGRYEMCELGNDVVKDIPIASGCFMFCRTEALKKLGGFSPDYFLYFEDFDLSLRMHALGRIDYVPSVRIVHHGGEAAKKGRRHIFMFVRSAMTFFNTHGWKIS